MNTFWLGLASGVPLMIAVGPIAVLLVELGVERGRAAWPAALGVAVADLTFATVAALCGASLQRALHPFAGEMQFVAAGFLLAMAAVMFRRSLLELRPARARFVPLSAALDRHSGEQNEVGEREVGERDGRAGFRLALTLTGLTMANPLTIAAFTSLVIATGERASNVGWPLGIATASLLVHLGLVGVGLALRRTLPPLGPAWLRLAGSVFIAGLATNLVLS